MNNQAYHPSEELGFVRLKWLLGKAMDGVDFIYRYRKLFVVTVSAASLVAQFVPKGNAASAQPTPALPVISAEPPKVLSEVLGQTREEFIVPSAVGEALPMVPQDVQQIPLPDEVKQVIPESPYPTVDLRNVKLRPLTPEEDVIAACLIFESGGEKDPIRGMQSIANAAQNRARYAGVPLYNVVAVPRHFSCFDEVTMSKNPGFLDKVEKAKRHPQWVNAQKIVILAVKNKLPDVVEGNTHYSNPKHSAGYKWEMQLKNPLRVGEHIFGKTAISKRQCGLGLSRALQQAASRRLGPERKGPREVQR